VTLSNSDVNENDTLDVMSSIRPSEIDHQEQSSDEDCSWSLNSTREPTDPGILLKGQGDKYILLIGLGDFKTRGNVVMSIDRPSSSPLSCSDAARDRTGTARAVVRSIHHTYHTCGEKNEFFFLVPPHGRGSPSPKLFFFETKQSDL